MGVLLDEVVAQLKAAIDKLNTAAVTTLPGQADAEQAQAHYNEAVLVSPDSSPSGPTRPTPSARACSTNCYANWRASIDLLQNR
jgi:hypothetical protein